MFIYEKRYSIDEILFSKVSSSSTLRSPIHKCFREANAFSDFRFETKLIISESTFRRSLGRMAVCKVLKSKVEIDLAFFLTLILFSIVPIGKEFCTTQNFLQPE